MKIPSNLDVGDMYATIGTSLPGWASRTLTTPKTDRFHHGLIKKVRDDGDFEVIESIGADLKHGGGIRVGLLSFYKDTDIRFYRVQAAEEKRYHAPDNLVKFGRERYDYFLAAKLVVLGVGVLIRHFKDYHRFVPVSAEELEGAYDCNSSFICTEAVDIAYLAEGVTLVPVNIPPLPCAMEQARLAGKFTEMPKDLEVSYPEVLRGRAWAYFHGKKVKGKVGAVSWK